MKTKYLLLFAVLALALLGLALGPQSARAATTFTVNAAQADDTGCASNHLCKTIQAALDIALDGDSINVLPGTYVENLTIKSGVTLTGAGQGKTTVYPALSAPNPCSGASLCTGASYLMLVQANNVTISGFTLDGDNPNLTSGLVRDGADLDARNGIITNHALGIYNNLVVHHVTINNIYLRGIYASSGGTFNFHDMTVDNVQGEDASIAMFNFGGSGVFARNTVSNANDAISSNWSTGTQYIGNTITASQSGIHTDNGGSGATADLIIGNTVTCGPSGYGIWNFVSYTPTRIEANRIFGCAVGLASFGKNAAAPSTSFAWNYVDGQHVADSVGMYATTDMVGYGDSDNVVYATNNTITNNVYGLATLQKNGKTTQLYAHYNNISGNTNQVDNADGGTIDATNNWWGSSAGFSGTAPAGVTVSPSATALVTGVTASTHEVGETATLNTNVTVNGLYGAQLLVNHENAILNFTATGSAANNVASTPPWAWDYLIQTFTHPTANLTELAGTMQGTLHAAGANLNGDSIATWKYTCVAPGTSALTYDTTPGTGTLLSALGGAPIVAALTGDSVTCTLATSAVDGFIGLQGRTKGTALPAGWNNAVVTLTCTSGACLGSGPYSMTTDKDGLYQYAKLAAGGGIPNGTYTMSVTRRAYLSATKASLSVSGGSVTLTPAGNPQVPTLLGGDITGDDTISIDDLTGMGGSFGTSVTADTGADVNGDGFVNIFDLVLAGGNYGVSGGQTW